MRILTYKRTHIGDPDRQGRFGIFNCMGRVRSYEYDAVIGIGGVGGEPKSFGIDRKLNWVGIGPRRSADGVVTFEHFALFDEQGPLFAEVAPHLAKRMYGRNVRVLLDGYTAREQAEAERVLRWSRTREAQGLGSRSVPVKRSGCNTRCMPARNIRC